MRIKNKETLKEKKILFFSPKFFSYEKVIKNKLENLGAKVEYYDDRPKNDFITKALIRINKNILKRKIEFYYDSIIKNTKNKKYDYIFFLTPDSITKSALSEFKRLHKESKFILYMWDSLKNRKNVFDLIEFFDEIYSFDKKDVQKYNFKFRPLFYMDEYQKIGKNKNKSSYDLTFIGTGHSDRYKIIQKITRELTGNFKSIKLYIFMYLPSRVVYIIKKIINNEIRKSNLKEFNFTSLSKEKIIEIIGKSNVILDIQHPNQTGLTMRTIEVIGAKKKLITTNSEIINYDFYNSSNIYVLDRKSLNIDMNFFNKKHQDIDDKLYYKYSIQGWINEIFAE